MTINVATTTRVDLLTDIHKALRKGLFDLSVLAGATDWTDPTATDRLAAHWRPLVELLRCHTDHENDHIFRLLDGTTHANAAPDSDHQDLDDLLEDLDERLAVLARNPGLSTGLNWYRDLNRFVAATLTHLHAEESIVLPALWAECTDDQLQACRAAFLAATPLSVLTTTMTLMREALPLTVQRTIGLTSA